MLKIILPVSLLLLVSCTRHTMVANSSAEEVVKRFVDLSTHARENGDREKLQGLCSGELKRIFQRMNPEAFKMIYIDAKVNLLDFKVLSFKQDGDKASIAYEVTIENNQGSDPTREQNRREVDLLRSQGQWFIDSIRMSGSDRVAFTKGMLF